MAHEFFYLGAAIGNQITVPGRNRLHIVVQKPFQRRDVIGHIATGRHDHDGRAIHNMVSGKHHALFLEQIAHVVIHMAGSADGPQRPIFAGNAIIVFNLGRGLEGQILVTIVLGGAPDERRPCPRGNERGAGGMVGVGVSTDHITETVANAIKNRVDMAVDSGAGINDRQIRFANHVGIRAGTGHRTGIGRYDATHPIGQDPDLAMGLHLTPPMRLSRYQGQHQRHNPRRRRRNQTTAETLVDSRQSQPVT